MLTHAFVFTTCKYICLWTCKISLNIVPGAHTSPHARTLYGHIALSGFLPPHAHRPPSVLLQIPNTIGRTSLFVGFPLLFVLTYFILSPQFTTFLHSTPSLLPYRQTFHRRSLYHWEHRDLNLLKSGILIPTCQVLPLGCLWDCSLFPSRELQDLTLCPRNLST